MLKIGSCTVLFNPDRDVISNVETYKDLVDVCVVVDNSEKKNEVSKYFEEDSSYIYIDMHGNQGIAAALNAGIEYLHSKNMGMALTMDQDSLFPTSDYLAIYQLIEKYKDEYSLIGLDVNRVDSSKEIVLVPYWITSGNFVNISDFYLAGKMNESLFIDYVDFDLGYRFKKAHLKIGYLSGYCITHTIGNPIPIHVLNKTFYALNHSPIRYYYRYRNAYYLYHYVDKEFFKKEYRREMFGSLIKMFIFEKKRNEKIKMIKKGLSDAKKRRLGKFNA
ncbi:glycosyltransferase [Holdemanella biformis]|uniref:glycosyltransferase n=1 Tax=Holdemanella biformis TaxID=1735 RepID=UPI0018973206|nr:glycosyltransferase [Holdemanella biformis]